MGKQTQRSFQRTITRTIGYRYLIALPKNYSRELPPPLLLFLHGAGERGSDIELVKRHGPPKLIARGQSLPFVVVSPQCPEGQWWDPEALNALVDDIVQEYTIDTNRLYVTGLSMGGFGTWSLGIASPGKFAALAPICGWGESFGAPRLKDTPVWAFHGAKDPVVPLAKQQEMINALKRAGAAPRVTVYPEAGHDSWTETYENPELFSWLLSHQKPRKK